MAGVNSRFARISESEIIKIQEDSVPENTKKATKFGLKVFKGTSEEVTFCKRSFFSLFIVCTCFTHELRRQIRRQ